MKKKDYKKITEERYDELTEINHQTITEKELIDRHEKLVDTYCGDLWGTKDCCIRFTDDILSLDWGKSIVYNYPVEIVKFIKSKYLSDYFKNEIKFLLDGEDIDNNVKNLIESDKKINDMSEEEIKGIALAIKKYEYYEEATVANLFRTYLYKLDGEGVISYIKNNIDGHDLISHILHTSGLSARASYYSGRGVNIGDLNESHLEKIFKELLKLDISYALEYVKMVQQMKTLGATEFIKTFFNFAENNFKAEDMLIDNDNMSLDGLHDESLGIVLVTSMALKRNRNEYIQNGASESMKRAFIYKIKPILKKLSPELLEEFENSDCIPDFYKHSKKIDPTRR